MKLGGKKRMSKTVLVLAGVSGSGKSTLATILQDLVIQEMDSPDLCGIIQDCGICSADHYFESEDGYKFDASKLKEAHESCRNQFDLLIGSQVDLVIVDNTNTSMRECQYYLDKAEESGYQAFYLAVIPYRAGQDNVHEVPVSSLGKQSDRLQNIIKTLLKQHISGDRDGT